MKENNNKSKIRKERKRKIIRKKERKNYRAVIIEMQIMVHSQFCLGLTALTGARLERLYLFGRLKHLLEYISEYE